MSPKKTCPGTACLPQGFVLRMWGRVSSWRGDKKFFRKAWVPLPNQATHSLIPTQPPPNLQTPQGPSGLQARSTPGSVREQTTLQGALPLSYSLAPIPGAPRVDPRKGGPARRAEAQADLVPTPAGSLPHRPVCDVGLSCQWASTAIR